MRSGLVSVVIPVYKVEEYLDRCLESIVRQTYKNLDIILIDDGSPDKCPQMCDEWSKKDSRIRVIHKLNEGLGEARNTGIECAKGEYICFVDSDDYIANDMVEKVYFTANKYNADVVCFGGYSVNSKGKVLSSRVPKVEKFVYRGSAIQNELLPNMVGSNPQTGKDYNIPMSACCKLYSLQTIRKHDWKFVSEREIISEDFYSILKLFKNLSVACVVPEAFYYYCENFRSVSRKYRPDRYEKVCHFHNESKKLCEEYGYNRDVLFRLDNIFLSFVIAILKQEFAYSNSLCEKRKRIKMVADDGRLQSVLFAHRLDCLGRNKRVLYWALRHRFYSVIICLLAIKKLVSD